MKLYAFELPQTDPCEAFAPLATLPYSLFLDSADRAHPDARYSFIAANPIETIEAKDGVVTITNAAQQTSFAADPFEIVKQRLAAHEFGESDASLPPFQGGAAGFFGYDLGRGIESLPATAAANKSQPDMAIGIYDTVIAFDHEENKAWIVIHARDEKEAGIKRALLQKPAQLPWFESAEMNWQSNFTPENYKAQVQKVIDYIFAGDIFQANLSQKFSSALPENFDIFAHYCALREVNPAPFAAYMNLGHLKIASASPERFITVKDRNVQTKPIKGTISRADDKKADEKQKQALYASEKDRAENIMIVDLLRNDLSKVCERASVNVDKLCGIESFAKVHHLVSVITARLKETESPTDLLKACFPGGSITGAPKIRAMEIIEELEPNRRGVYCGALGYISHDNKMDMNILIRTLIYEGDKVSFQTGGGITAGSDPQAEYDETLAKADGIFDSYKSQDTSYKKAS